MRKIILYILTFITLAGFAQTNSTEKKLTDQITKLDFLTIKINHGAERYDRKEINVIYHQDYKLKIHSILISNYEKDKKIDTTFILSDEQIMLIDKFGEDFNKNTITSEQVWGAGSRTFYCITLNNSTATFDDKSGYSLIIDLLKK